MSDTVALAFALIAHCLCNLNSAINPVIYYLMSGKRSVYICARAAHCAYSINENEKKQVIEEFLTIGRIAGRT